MYLISDTPFKAIGSNMTAYWDCLHDFTAIVCFTQAILERYTHYGEPTENIQYQISDIGVFFKDWLVAYQ